MSFCVQCGAELNEFNSIKLPYKGKGKRGINPTCLDCQEKYFKSIIKFMKYDYRLTTFICCGAFNVPYFDDAVLPAINTVDPWGAYLAGIRATGKLDSCTQKGRERTAGFIDGEGIPLNSGTNPLLSGNYEGTAAQIEEWGDAYTAEEYRELDRIYRMLSQGYTEAVDGRLSFALHKVCKLQLEQDKALKAGDDRKAKSMSDQLKQAMELEGMRANDAKPVEPLKIDIQIAALEKAGLFRKGRILPRAELARVLGRDTGKYNTSLDVVDSMMFAIMNTGRKNGGMFEFDTLPPEAQVEDAHGELLTEMSDKEKAAMKALGLVQPKRD